MDATYDENNVFAQILRGDAPCIKLFEDEKTLAFMDIMPQTEGHVLVIPKFPAITLYDLPDDYASASLKTVKRMGRAVEKAMGISGSTLFQHNGRVAGQSVPHFHFHIFPGPLKGLFEHAQLREDPAVLAATARKIIAALEAMDTES